MENLITLFRFRYLNPYILILKIQWGARSLQYNGCWGHYHSRYTITMKGTVEGCAKIFPLKILQWQALDSLLNVTAFRGVEGLYNYLRDLIK